MKVINPLDVEPTINSNSPAHVSGQQVHRRILTPTTGGPLSMDVGYNLTKAGLDYNTPYAYDRDEFCYNAQGVARVESDGDIVLAKQDMFMWRPVGAATQRIFIEENYNSICAFSPARTDGWSHILPDDRIGKWPEGEVRPKVQFASAKDIEPSELPDADAGVRFRRIFDVPHMEVSHTIIPAGMTLSFSRQERDEIYWLETGEILVTDGTTSQTMRATEFLFVPADERFDAMAATVDSVVLRWAAVVRPSSEAS